MLLAPGGARREERVPAEEVEHHRQEGRRRVDEVASASWSRMEPAWEDHSVRVRESLVSGGATV